MNIYTFQINFIEDFLFTHLYFNVISKWLILDYMLGNNKSIIEVLALRANMVIWKAFNNYREMPIVIDQNSRLGGKTHLLAS